MISARRKIASNDRMMNEKGGEPSPPTLKVPLKLRPRMCEEIQRQRKELRIVERTGA